MLGMICRLGTTCRGENPGPVPGTRFCLARQVGQERAGDRPPGCGYQPRSQSPWGLSMLASKTFRSRTNSEVHHSILFTGPGP